MIRVLLVESAKKTGHEIIATPNFLAYVQKIFPDKRWYLLVLNLDIEGNEMIACVEGLKSLFVINGCVKIFFRHCLYKLASASICECQQRYVKKVGTKQRQHVKVGG